MGCQIKGCQIKKVLVWIVFILVTICALFPFGEYIHLNEVHKMLHQVFSSQNGSYILITTNTTTVPIITTTVPIITTTKSPIITTTKSPIITTQKSPIKPRKKCITLLYENIGTIYNCSINKNNSKSMGIVSMHVDMKEYDIEKIKFNHLTYTKKFGYIYFEITNYTNINVTDHYPIHSNTNVHKRERDIRLLSKLKLIYKVISENDNLDYLFWMDFDALFWNCSQSIQQSIIAKSRMIYKKINNNTVSDMIFSYDPFTIINSGIILFKNSNWTLSVLQEMISMSIEFASNWEKIRNWGDQNIYIAILMGYNDNNNKYHDHNQSLNNFNYQLTKDPLYGCWVIEENNYIKVTECENSTYHNHGIVQFLSDDSNLTLSTMLHKTIDSNIKYHVSILPPMDMNFGYYYYQNVHIKSKLQYQPFIMHFFGPFQKKYLRKGRRIADKPQCFIRDIKDLNSINIKQ